MTGEQCVIKDKPRQGVKSSGLCTTEEFRCWVHSTGYSLRAIGRLFGVSGGSVDNWYHGRVPVPDRIARYLAAEGAIPRRHQRRRGINHEPLCPPKSCRSCSLRRLRRQRTWVSYTWPEAATNLLREMAPAHTLDEITEALRALNVLRTVTRTAVDGHARRHKILIAGRGYTADQIARILGYHSQQAVIGWLKAGLLPSYQKKFNTPYTVADEDLEAFFRRHHGFFDHRKMPVFRGKHKRWAQLIWQLNTRNPHWSTDEIAAFAGCSLMTVKRAIYRGSLPGICLSAGYSKRWMVPRAVVIRWAREREAMQA